MDIAKATMNCITDSTIYFVYSSTPRSGNGHFGKETHDNFRLAASGR